MIPALPTTQNHRLHRLFGLLVLLASLVLVPGVGAQSNAQTGYAQDDSGAAYSYIVTAEGQASLFASGADTSTEVERNIPVLVGDQFASKANSRFDLWLSDGSRLALDELTTVRFDSIGGSPMGDGTESGRQGAAVAERTHLYLFEGRLVLSEPSTVATSYHQVRERIIDTGNARIYLQQPGKYIVFADGERFTEVIVRSGSAEVVDQRGSSVVRAGEAIVIEGANSPNSRLVRPQGESRFEAWAGSQTQVRLASEESYLDEPLRYRAADIEDHGEWVVVEKRKAWRPRVVADWQPYSSGYWRRTPRGLYWVSSDPWSSVTWHYGSWDRHPLYGWVWYPGRSWAPAHVYWYWGSTYSAWVPYGYYSSYYGHRYGFRRGVYGWAGGSWDPFYDWVFCPVRYVGYRNQRRYHDYGYRMGRHGHRPRGIITTDTHGIGHAEMRRPGAVRDLLNDRGRQRLGRQGRELPDVTPFVGRQRELPQTVREAVAPEKPRRGQRLLPTPVAGGARTVSNPPARATAPARAGATRSVPTDAARARPEAGERTDATRQAPARRVLDNIRQGETRGNSRTRVAPSSRPQTRQPVNRAPQTRQPVNRAPQTRQPVNRAPQTRQPVSRAPQTRQPVNRAPQTRQPVSRAPQTRQPVSRAPQTRQPVSRAPQTRQPVNRAPQTRQPASRAPQTRQPSSRAPRTRQPAARAPQARSTPRSSGARTPSRARPPARTRAPQSRSGSRSSAGRAPATRPRASSPPPRARGSSSSSGARSSSRSSGSRSSQPPARRRPPQQ